MLHSRSDRLYAVLVSVVAGLTMLLLAAPTLVVVVVSFTGGSTLKFPPESWSLRWYGALLQSPDLWAPALNSVTVALAATFAALALGTLAALSIARSRHPLARGLDTLFMSPLVLPTMAFGLSLFLVLNLMGVRLSLTTLVLGHTIICVPYVIRMVGASLQQLDGALFEASTSLGASRAFTFWNITLPLVRRGVVAGGLVAFLSSFDDVPVSLFLADARTPVLPIHLWAILEGGLDVRVAAVSGVVIVVTAIGLVAADRFVGVGAVGGRS